MSTVTPAISTTSPRDRFRGISYLPTRFSVIDETHAIIRISGEKRYLALSIENQSLAQSLKNYFAILWKGATRIRVS